MREYRTQVGADATRRWIGFISDKELGLKRRRSLPTATHRSRVGISTRWRQSNDGSVRITAPRPKTGFLHLASTVAQPLPYDWNMKLQLGFRSVLATGTLLILAATLTGCATSRTKLDTKSARISKTKKRRPGPHHDEIKAELSQLQLEKPVLAAATPIPVAAHPPPAPAPKKEDVPSLKKSMIALARKPRVRAAAKLEGPLTGGEIKAKLQDRVPTAAGNSAPSEGIEGQIDVDDDDQNAIQFAKAAETPLIFDIPVTYNERVRQWIRYFQSEGRSSFRTWLERSARFLPLIQFELTRAAMPLDLSYVAMIESGFQSHASSHAGAIGLWQFIETTGTRFGLKVDWWIDERRDFYKSTKAAIRYMSTLNKQFESWYLVAASYNMGENGVRRLISKRKTNNFWELADLGALPQETRDYVPKIIAAILISKAPALYGFRDLNYQMPLSYDSIAVPGGTDLINLANYLGVSEKYLKDLNPELIKGFIPRGIRSHKIRVPKGSGMSVSQYIQQQMAPN